MSSSTSTTTWTVSGMTCEHCVAAVTEEVGAVPGVTAVQVDLATGALTVTSETALEESTVAAAVDEAGYRLAGAA
jgi:copper chaperone CopZ